MGESERRRRRLRSAQPAPGAGAHEGLPGDPKGDVGPDDVARRPDGVSPDQESPISTFGDAATADTAAVMDPADQPGTGIGEFDDPAGEPDLDRPPGRPGPGSRPEARPVSGAGAGPRPTAGPGLGSPSAMPGRPTSGAGVGTRPASGPVFAGRPPAARPGPGGDDREAERGLRGLVGSGSSQVSVNAALRARDAARPTPEQLAEAEEHLVIVRRNWLPREELPRNR
jgi:hypothetical protein